MSKSREGYIHIYTGEGKGKTTASIGLALRAKSRDLSVLFVQFMKTDREGAELDVLQGISVVVKRYSGIKSPHFHPDLDRKKMGESAEQAIQEVMGMAADYDVVVLDEFNNLVRVDMISEERAIDFMKAFPRETELILTGRGATDAMMRLADYVTYMEEVRHPLRDGTAARRGIEY